MTILVLSPFFFPEPISSGKYNAILAQQLARRGARVVALASHPLYPLWRPARSTAKLEGVSIIRGGAWVRYPKKAILRRFVLETWYAAFACWSCVRLKEKPTQVVAILPPTLFLVLLRAILPRGIPIVGIVHDIQAVLAARSKSTMDRVLRSAIRRIERRSYLSCDRLIFLSHSMAERAIREYGLRREICAVHYPFQTLPRGGAAQTNLQDSLPDSMTNVVYSGALGSKQNPGGLLRFMSALAQRDSSIACHIFSAGPEFERLKRAHAHNHESRVFFHPLVAEEHLNELYARSAVQIIPQAGGTADGALPSKLPNLLAGGVPVFAICEDDSEVGKLLAAAGAGVTALSFDGDETLSRFETLLKSIAAEPRQSRIERLRTFVEGNFSVDGLVDDILDQKQTS